MAISEHVGRESSLPALGKTWRVGRWTRAIWDGFVEWAKPRIKDPLEVAQKHLDRFPPGLQSIMVQHALELSSGHLALNGGPVQGLLATLDGSAYLLYLLLKQHHPEMTEDLAFEIAMDVDEKELKRVFDRSAGKVPPSAQGNASAPADSPPLP